MEATPALTRKNSVMFPAKSTCYTLLNPIGQGSYGLVWKATVQVTEGISMVKKTVAIKIIDLE